MSKIYHIKHLRLINDLEVYLNKNQMSPVLKSYMHKNGINKKKFYEFFDGIERPEVKKLYSKLVLAYQRQTKNDSEIDLQLRYDLEDSYFTVIENFLTKGSSYYFPSILKKYRPEDVQKFTKERTQTYEEIANMAEQHGAPKVNIKEVNKDEFAERESKYDQNKSKKVRRKCEYYGIYQNAGSCCF